MAKVAITCNGSEPGSVYPAFILGSSAAALGDDVVLFFTPAAARALVAGELEKMRGAKGLPDIIDLYESLLGLRGTVYACELALEAKDLTRDAFRTGVEVVGVTTFLSRVHDATLTFSF
jgi:predicted peroxiredoxin